MNSPPFEVLPGLRQQHGHLQREDVLAVEVLVQAVVVLGPVLEQQGRRPVLAGLMAARDEGGVVTRKPDIHPHSLVPAIGQRSQVRIERGPQRLNEGRQRVAEVAVFAATEPVPRHNDLAAEALDPTIQGRRGLALRVGEQPRQEGPTSIVQVRRDARPIDGVRP
jgi:hypothetical protein